MDKTADVVVIGGGAVGTSVAYFLAKRNLDVPYFISQYPFI